MNPAINHPAVQRLFAGTKNLFARDQFMEAMKASETVEVNRLPVDMLPPALLLATVAREYKEGDVVDSITQLHERIEREYKSADTKMWHPDGYLVSCVVSQGAELHGHEGATYVQQAWKELTGVFTEPISDPGNGRRKGKGKLPK